MTPSHPISPPPTSRWHDWIQLTRFDKPVGSYLLLWPTFWALWVAAEGIPTWQNLVIFTLGVFLMRSAGCVINDYADRHIDRHVERTQNRPLTQGRIGEKEALIGFGMLCLIAFALVLMTNLLTIALSTGGLLLAALYPFMKRHTHWPQAFLGAAFSWSIPMAFAAESHTIPLVCWLLYAANLCWTIAYDTIYAMVDRNDDLKIGVKSTAILFADRDLMIIGALFAGSWLCLITTGIQLELAWPFYLGLLMAASFHGWQLWFIRNRDRDSCFTAFRASHWFGAAVLLGMIASYAV